MAQFFQIHPKDPQARLIRRTVDIVRDGGIIVYPTDSSYALGCQIGEKSAMERIRRIRRLDDKHNFTLVCRDLSEIATYAKIDDQAYRMLKSLTPGAYTFMPANRCKPDTSGRIKILQVQRIPASADAPNSGPGSICLISPLGPVVKTGDDLLCVTAIQPDGGRPMDGKSFLNGHPLIIGDRFESAPPNL